jgi:hypothetical protein
MKKEALSKIEDYMIELERVNNFLLDSITNNENNPDLMELLNKSEIYSITLIKLHQNIISSESFFEAKESDIKDTLALIHRFCLFFNKV